MVTNAATESARRLLELWEGTAENDEIDIVHLRQCFKQGDSLSVLEAFDFLVESKRRLNESISQQVTQLHPFILERTKANWTAILNPSAGIGRTESPAFRIANVIFNIIVIELRGLIRSHFFSGNIPSSGVILYFSTGLHYCYIISYSIDNNGPEIELVDRIPSPTGLLELRTVNQLENPFSRNVAKEFLTSGHKTVLQKGTLTHVDRRVDVGVFGPTIDTLILAEIAADYLSTTPVTSALEIGAGSGHTISVVASHAGEHLNRIAFVDIDVRAVECTQRNLLANIEQKDVLRIDDIDVTGAVGRYTELLFSGEFDLMICNPPYIALPPSRTARPNRRLFTDSVAGEDLLKHVLALAPDRLTKKGRLLLMTSSASLSMREFNPPNDWRVEQAHKDVEVPFDVEAVLSDEDWTAHLVQEGAIVRKGDSFWHQLKPIWFQRSEHNG